MHLIVAAVAAITAVNFLAIDPVRGQSLSSAIVGCAAVDCPGDSATTTNAKCTVVDKTFTTIGLARIPVSSNALTGLSWTEGVAVTDAKDQRTFEKDFYLGTPPHTNLTGTGACAVFFSQVSNRVSFNASSIEEAQGTCQDAMSSDCVNALITRAVAVNVSGLGSAGACSKLQAAFNDNLDAACASFATGRSWTGLSVKALSVAGAADPITAAQNSTSNCWPILPKQYDLALANSFTSSGDFSAQTLEANFYGITPILTLFYPGNGSLVTQAEAQVTCMKTVGPSEGANSTQSDTDKSSANALYGLGIPALGTALTLLTSFIF